MSGHIAPHHIERPWAAVYGATNAFVLSFSEALYYEYRDRGVQVTALCPGNTESNFARVANTAAGKGAKAGDSPEMAVDVGLHALVKAPAASFPELRTSKWHGCPASSRANAS